MFLRHNYAAITWTAVILYLTLIPGDALPEGPFVGVDKLVHFLMFGILMFLTGMGLKKYFTAAGRPEGAVRISVLYSTGLGIAVEILQRYVPGRNFSLADIIANSIGVFLGYLALKYLRRK